MIPLVHLYSQKKCSYFTTVSRIGALHLLKLDTGVEISTRPVRKSGRLGKSVKRTSRTAAAARNMPAFRTVGFDEEPIL